MHVKYCCNSYDTYNFKHIQFTRVHKSLQEHKEVCSKKNEINGLLCPHSPALDLALNKEYTNSWFFNRIKTETQLKGHCHDIFP